MGSPELRLLAWELTRRCNLRCRQCRASACGEPLPGEFTTEESIELLEEIANFSKPAIIFTGGEPLLRADLDVLVRRACSLGLRALVATNGTLLDIARARELKDAGVVRVSISLDGNTPELHDSFRGEQGAFEGALRGIEALRSASLPFQINTTITRRNAHILRDMIKLAESLGAKALHIFLLVPTGRGREIEDEGITAREYERLLLEFIRAEEKSPLELKATCAPHYFRIASVRGADLKGRRGCLGGIHFCFISYDGIVSPCGYLELDCGSVRKEKFPNIWKNSSVLRDLRDFDKYKGKCGRCGYVVLCGGCRARAYARTGDYLQEEPFCAYHPRS